MKFIDLLTNDSVVAEINRICGSAVSSYSNQSKAARLNAALDRYFTLAFESDGRWSFDDINQTSPPIDTQDIVSGTNRYKVSSFTEKILSLIKLEVLDSSGKGVFITPETIDNLDVLSTPASGQISGISSNTFQELYLKKV